MFTAATRANEESEWYIKPFNGMLGAYRLDQKTWTEEEATAAGLYSDDIMPYTQRIELTKYQKYGIATVVEGRVVWPVLEMSAAEIAAVDKRQAEIDLDACQCAVNGRCMMMEIAKWNIENGTPPRDALTPEFLELFDTIVALQSGLDDA